MNILASRKGRKHGRNKTRRPSSKLQMSRTATNKAKRMLHAGLEWPTAKAESLSALARLRSCRP